MNEPSPDPRVAIVVPVLDEAAALPSLLAELAAAGWLPHTVFADNGSTDGGDRLVEGGGGILVRERRRGYGYACLAGARAAAAAGASVLVFMEGDGTDDPREVARLAGPILDGELDLNVGSRRAAVRRGAPMPLHQRVGEWLSVAALRLLFGVRVPDNGPFRAIRADQFASLDMEPRAYSWTTEMLVKAHLAGARIGTTETAFRPRHGDSKISGTIAGTVGAAAGIFGSMLRLRLRGSRPTRSPGAGPQ